MLMRLVTERDQSARHSTGPQRGHKHFLPKIASDRATGLSIAPGPAPGAQAALEVFAGHIPRVVRAPILWEAPIDRIVLEPARRLIEPLDTVHRQRQDCGPEPRVRIAVTRPAVAFEEELTPPAGR